MGLLKQLLHNRKALVGVTILLIVVLVAVSFCAAAEIGEDLIEIDLAGALLVILFGLGSDSFARRLQRLSFGKRRFETSFLRGGLAHQRVELDLGAQTKADRVLRLDVRRVPGRAVAHRHPD